MQQSYMPISNKIPRIQRSNIMRNVEIEFEAVDKKTGEIQVKQLTISARSKFEAERYVKEEYRNIFRKLLRSEYENETKN